MPPMATLFFYSRLIAAGRYISGTGLWLITGTGFGRRERAPAHGLLPDSRIPRLWEQD